MHVIRIENISESISKYRVLAANEDNFLTTALELFKQDLINLVNL